MNDLSTVPLILLVGTFCFPVYLVAVKRWLYASFSKMAGVNEQSVPCTYVCTCHVGLVWPFPPRVRWESHVTCHVVCLVFQVLFMDVFHVRFCVSTRQCDVNFWFTFIFLLEFDCNVILVEGLVGKRKSLEIGGLWPILFMNETEFSGLVYSSLCPR